MAAETVETFHEDGQWKNRVQGNDRASTVHDTKDEAVARGRELAENRGGEHIIKRMDGTIEAKYSHGNDPKSSKG